MASTSTSVAMGISHSSENRRPAVADSNMPTAQTTLNLPIWTALDGPVAILWDIENCPVPNDVRPEDAGGNIRMALRVHPVIRGAVTTFSAYGDFNSFPRRLREGCQRTGVKLIDVPNGRKDAADKAILVDMFLFALDNPPPSSIMLISGDVDFAPALHILGQRGYTIILVIPSGVGVSSALTNAGKFVWDWPSVARGEAFVPASKAIMAPYGGSADIAAYLEAWHINDSLYNQKEEQAIVYKGTSQSYYNLRDYCIVSQSLSEYNSNSAMTLPFFPSDMYLPSCLNEVLAGSTCDDQYHSSMWVQPGDINGLKLQLVKLLEMSGGCLPLSRVPSEYQKIYGRPIYFSEYGVSKFMDLFKKMGDAIAIDGKSQKKFVYLRSWKAVPSASPLILARKDKRGKETQVENSERGNRESTCNESAAQCETGDWNLEQFKYELQEILVSYSCGIFLGCFEAVYEQRYKKKLDCRRFGVDQLEDLFTKVRDVVALHEEPASKKKFLTAIGG